MITVSELRDILNGFSKEEGDVEVILSSGAEGNSYSPLDTALRCKIYGEGRGIEVPHNQDIDEDTPETRYALVLWSV